MAGPTVRPKFTKELLAKVAMPQKAAPTPMVGPAVRPQFTPSVISQVAQPKPPAPVQPQAFDNNDIEKFRDLVSKGVEAERAKSLILQSKGQAQQPNVPANQSQNPSMFQNIAEGVVDYAGNLPKVIADMGLLDKPAQYLAQKYADIQTKRTGIRHYVKDPNAKFSDVTKGSQVGGDPNSKAAKLTSNILGGLELAGGLGAPLAAKAIAKNRAKSVAKALSMIEEPNNVKALRGAIKSGRAVAGKSSAWSGKQAATITAKPKLVRGAELLAKGGAPKDPIKAYSKASHIIDQKATVLGDSLKNMKVGTMTASKAKIRKGVKEIVGIGDQFTKAQQKAIKETISMMDNAKTADDVRKARMYFDNQFPESVKGALDTAAPTTLKAKQLWRSTRAVFNDELDNMAKMFGDDTVKGAFNDMSALYEAQQNILIRAGELLKKTPGAKQKLIDVAKNAIKYGGIGIGTYKGVEALANK